VCKDDVTDLLYFLDGVSTAKERLAEDGIIITQAGPGGCVSSTEVAVPVYNTMKEVFPHVSCYLAHIPSFLDLYAYVAASNTIDLKTALGTAQEIDQKIEERLDGRHETEASPDAVGASILGFYDGESHQNMFALPKWLRNLFKTFTIIITDDSPRYML
jgi:thermospermine synthase